MVPPAEVLHPAAGNGNVAPVVLMYHGILRRKRSAIGVRAADRDGFARQMSYLKRNFRIIHLSELEGKKSRAASNGKRPLLITLDDGFGNNATIAWPILEELQIPAVFLVCTRHLQPSRYLWFAHARALFHLWPMGEVWLLHRWWKLGTRAAREYAVRQFMEETHRFPMDEIYRELAQYPPQDFVPPHVIEEELRGMTAAETAAIAQSPLMTIGGHTCNHPYLTECRPGQVEQEIRVAKEHLETVCGRPITAFAYPDGDYDRTIAERVKEAGFRTAFAVSSRIDTSDSKMEIPRVGIYRAGLGILAAKSYGLIS